MPFEIKCIYLMLCKHIGPVFNFGMLMLTFLESYLIPLAIVKWVMIIIKCSSALTQLKQTKARKELTRCYRYQLHLTTIDSVACDIHQAEQASHVSVLVDGQGMQLTYCGQDCRRIPPALQKMYGTKVKCLDLSYNNIETLKGLDQFTVLEELILDNNKLSDHISFPYLPTLKTLSLNNNEITDLEELMNKVSKNFPSLTYLSLLSNKACPNQLSDVDKDDSDYQRYRYFVLHCVPSLQFLDSRRVAGAERREARARGQFMRVRRPPAPPTLPPAPPAPPRDVTRALPVDFSALGKHRGAYGKCNYKYTGKHSEGNRFIVNSDL